MAPAVSAVAVNAIRYAAAPGGERRASTPVASAGKVRKRRCFFFFFLSSNHKIKKFAFFCPQHNLTFASSDLQVSARGVAPKIAPGGACNAVITDYFVP